MEKVTFTASVFLASMNFVYDTACMENSISRGSVIIVLSTRSTISFMK